MDLRKGYLQSSYNYYIAERDKHVLDLEVYLSNPVAIGEHSDIIETIELDLDKAAAYHDKLEMLTKYFIEPQLQQEEKENKDD